MTKRKIASMMLRIVLLSLASGVMTITGRAASEYDKDDIVSNALEMHYGGLPSKYMYNYLYISISSAVLYFGSINQSSSRS